MFNAGNYVNFTCSDIPVIKLLSLYCLINSSKAYHETSTSLLFNNFNFF